MNCSGTSKPSARPAAALKAMGHVLKERASYEGVYQGDGETIMITEALWCSDRHHVNRFVCEQPPYNLLDRRIERELLPMCRTHGIATIPWSPIGGGLLTGKYRAGQPIATGTRYAEKETNPFLSSRWTDATFAIIEKLLPLAEARHVPLSQFALA
jgi:aryl-alcohol dehydrogenase-like predicted oxidoreductase